jgi:hypothetical protein
MVQHLEICEVLAMACSYYAKKAHLLQVCAHRAVCLVGVAVWGLSRPPRASAQHTHAHTHPHTHPRKRTHTRPPPPTPGLAAVLPTPPRAQFFAPAASIGGVQLPAAVYLVDLVNARPQTRNLLSLIAPVLSSSDNIKVGLACCWGGGLGRGRAARECACVRARGVRCVEPLCATRSWRRCVCCWRRRCCAGRARQPALVGAAAARLRHDALQLLGHAAGQLCVEGARPDRAAVLLCCQWPRHRHARVAACHPSSQRRCTPPTAPVWPARHVHHTPPRAGAVARGRAPHVLRRRAAAHR